jgi:predicted Zn-dependent protease
MQRVALHEFGHVLGLDHPDDHGQIVTAIMNSRASNVDALQRDDIEGVAAIYTALSATSLESAPVR